MQYNHPDNMSAAEKMKIELAKVREEFKMSESDCGSIRVQGIGFLFLTLLFGDIIYLLNECVQMILDCNQVNSTSVCSI